VAVASQTAWLEYASFFFQAEDGIRDGHVTGVQTCALPIWRIGSGLVNLGALERQRIRDRHVTGNVRQDDGVLGRDGIKLLAIRRSEERRVGKECRSRWLGGR